MVGPVPSLEGRDAGASVTISARSNNSLTIFTATDETSDISSEYLAALAVTLDYSSQLINPNVLYTWGGLTGDELDELCTEACLASIAFYRSGVLEACADDVYTDTPINSTEYIAGTATLGTIYNYDLTCLKDSVTDEYCYLITGNGTDYNVTASNPCGTCGLEPFWLQMEDARMYDESLAAEYEVLASSCSVTAALTTPTAVLLSNPNTIVNNSTTTTSTCTGSAIAVPTGLTCDEVAKKYSVGTSQLLSDNSLPAGCVGWPNDATELCIQNTCQTYLAQESDTCTSIALTNNITVTQLVTWNPFIDPQCVNCDYNVGHNICVSSPLGYEYPVSTVTDVSGTTATSAAASSSNTGPESNADCGSWYLVQEGDYCSLIPVSQGISLDNFFFLNPEVNSNCTNLYHGYHYCVEAVGSISTCAGYGGTFTVTSTSATITEAGTTVYVSALSTAASPIYNFSTTASLPLASGSVSDCFNVFENTYSELSCVGFARWQGVPLDNLILWNPSTSTANTSSNYDCVLQNNIAYCAASYDNTSNYTTTTVTSYTPAPTNATTNATTECLSWYETVDGATCQHILDQYEITLAAFYEWKPAVGEDCTNLWVDASYCVLGPGWEYIVGVNTTQPGTMTGATSTTSTVSSTSTSLDTTTSEMITTTTVNPTTTTTIGTSAFCTLSDPTQTGISSSCNLYAEPISGDGCYDFAARFSITLNQFFFGLVRHTVWAWHRKKGYIRDMECQAFFDAWNLMSLRKCLE
ncbi:hypothetical protein BKA67DRAFT_691661 [Truncatella angustata]|uniref:LysM domain-containing protein n=1 Tax=Truncatella angustata TaxID=152316 RepID=A0A9P8UM39_9PEZI|nr:uncharacterized protein BKA67DRAFT_691661 [Truncatella angustata]KAH6654671.1 hypothetical protein BKA67DRAFT_691661 [Truncatella angustata]